MNKIRSRLSYANVMATIAVFIALGGASYAAVNLPKNSVGSKQLKKNAVTTQKLKKGAVTGAKIKNGTITGNKISVQTLGTVPSAAKATNADNATNAGNATTASNALALGGKAASEYSVRYFARVNGTTATPTLAAGSPGVTVNSSRPFTGAATVHFPVDMTNCAVVATGVSGGPSMYIRQSSISSANDVVVITENSSSASTNYDFNVVGVC